MGRSSASMIVVLCSETKKINEMKRDQTFRGKGRSPKIPGYADRQNTYNNNNQIYPYQTLL